MNFVGWSRKLKVHRENSQTISSYPALDFPQKLFTTTTFFFCFSFLVSFFFLFFSFFETKNIHSDTHSTMWAGRWFSPDRFPGTRRINWNKFKVFQFWIYSGLRINTCPFSIWLRNNQWKSQSFEKFLSKFWVFIDNTRFSKVTVNKSVFGPEYRSI